MARILLINNYAPDQQWSMLQYGKLLKELLCGKGWDVLVWQAPMVFGKGKTTVHGAPKLAGYIDKYILGPISLRRYLHRLKQDHALPDLICITDHSNAVYATHLPALPLVITLHDLIALRRALGEFPIPPPSMTGRMQQRWILGHLRHARHLVCISEASRQDYARLTGNSRALTNCPVIYPCLGQTMKPLSEGEAGERLSQAGITLAKPTLYHHGGDTWYKNRDAVIHVFAEASSRNPELTLVFSGSPLSHTHRKRLHELGLESRCHDLGPVSGEVLEALYNQASVFLFPSIVEGFGWPPVEAQACGCPVVASYGGSLKEVLGDSALLFSPDETAGMASAVLALVEDKNLARTYHEAGLRNIQRFTREIMQNAYHDYFTQLCAESQQS